MFQLCKQHLLRRVLFYFRKPTIFYKNFIVKDKVLCYDTIDILDGVCGKGGGSGEKTLESAVDERSYLLICAGFKRL